MHVPLNVEKVTCHAVGIPMNRGRAIITLVHKEVIGKSSSHQALQEEVSDSFRLTKRNPTQMLDLASALGCRSTPASPAKRARLDTLPPKLPPKAPQRTSKPCAAKCWPKAGTTAGHPFTPATPELLPGKPNPRELDAPDCLALHHDGKSEEGITGSPATSRRTRTTNRGAATAPLACTGRLNCTMTATPPRRSITSRSWALAMR